MKNSDGIARLFLVRRPFAIMPIVSSQRSNSGDGRKFSKLTDGGGIESGGSVVEHDVVAERYPLRCAGCRQWRAESSGFR
ncbi:hypothetical protein KCP70_03780 [Salmonella enterica subsp. enterica]|nr:hypothetical protein KCP70_03780 [Salmonella enterica subsp. enterica]